MEITYNINKQKSSGIINDYKWLSLIKWQHEPFFIVFQRFTPIYEDFLIL
jgi:hypothetical protein